MTLSILIVNWRSKDYVRQCLLSIRTTCAAFRPQIVVVDGASFDGCAGMIRAEFPEVEFVQSQENVGFGKCNNLGFETVTGEAVLLLNPDTELKDGAVSLLLRTLTETPGVGMVGARLLNTDGTLQTSCVQSLPTPLNQALDSEFLRKLFPNSSLWGISALWQSSPAEVEAISGACMLLRSETFRQAGGFGAQYFMYGEDMDLCAKVRKAGLKIYYEPRAEILHHGGGSTGRAFSKRSAVLMRHSIFLFLRAHRGAVAAFIYRVVMACSAVFRVALLAVVCVLKRAPGDSSRVNALRKWLAVFRWSAGLESAMVRPT